MAVPTTLHPDLLATLQLGLSLHVGACKADGEPVMARALDIRVEPDLRLSVLLPLPAGEAVLQALQRAPRVAVVASQPTTHKAVQIKGEAVVVHPDGAMDWPNLPTAFARFAVEIGQLGFAPGIAATLLEVPLSRCRVVSFRPTGAWDQTPGPGAGQPMPLFCDH